MILKVGTVLTLLILSFIFWLWGFLDVIRAAKAILDSEALYTLVHLLLATIFFGCAWVTFRMAKLATESFFPEE